MTTLAARAEELAVDNASKSILVAEMRRTLEMIEEMLVNVTDHCHTEGKLQCSGCSNSVRVSLMAAHKHVPSTQPKPPEIPLGSLWRKNGARWANDIGHVVRVEQYTPHGRVVLRRMDGDHEFIFDTETLLEAFDPVE